MLTFILLGLLHLHGNFLLYETWASIPKLLLVIIIIIYPPTYLPDAETETPETDVVTTNSVIMIVTVQVKIEVFHQKLVLILMMH